MCATCTCFQLQELIPALGLLVAHSCTWYLAICPVVGAMSGKEAMPWVKQGSVAREPSHLVFWSCQGTVELGCTGMMGRCMIRLVWVDVNYCLHMKALRRHCAPTAHSAEVQFCSSREPGTMNPTSLPGISFGHLWKHAHSNKATASYVLSCLAGSSCSDALMQLL